jgi:hypothetical protein
VSETPERLTGLAADLFAIVVDDLTGAVANSRVAEDPGQYLEAFLVGYINALRERIEK